MRFPFLSAFILCVVAMPALAGFEWVPPSNNPTVETYAPPAPAYLPEQPNVETIQSIRKNEKMSNQIIQAPPAVPVQDIAEESAPVKAKAKTGLMIDPMPFMPDKTDLDTPVNGFGDNLPLALALAEIVPSHFSYAFASGTIAGLGVSWDGKGKPWPQVVSEMLAPYRLMASFRGNILMISPQPSVQATAIAPKPMTAAAAPTMKQVATPVMEKAAMSPKPAEKEPIEFEVQPDERISPLAQPNDAPVALIPMPGSY